MAHIFISYRHGDGDFAAALREQLRGAGFEVWLDTDLQAGDQWREGIDQAIRDALALIVVMTPAAKASEYVTYEWACAWGAGVKVIPILLEPTTLHPRLETLQYLDFSDRASRPWDRLIGQLQDLAGAARSGGVRVPRDAPSAVKQAVTALDSPNPAERKTALESLAQIDHPSARAVLSDALAHPVGDVGIHAALQLARLDDTRAVPRLIDAIQSEDRPTRQAAIEALGRLRDAAAVPPLLEILGSKSAVLRRVTAEALGQIRDAVAVAGLVAALHDEDTDVRRTAADALAKIGVPAVPSLIQVTHDTDWYVRVQAIRALGQIGHASAVPRLVELLADTTQSRFAWTRICDLAAEALQQIGSPEAMAAYMRWKRFGT